MTQSCDRLANTNAHTNTNPILILMLILSLSLSLSLCVCVCQTAEEADPWKAVQALSSIADDAPGTRRYMYTHIRIKNTYVYIYTHTCNQALSSIADDSSERSSVPGDYLCNTSFM